MKHNLNLKRVMVITLILIIGSVLRLTALTEYPKGLYPQEALIGYRALLLSDTGKDELNRVRPLIFVSSQDYQLPVPVYSIVPFVKVFGLSKFSIRLPYAIAGILSVYGIFLLGKIIFKESKYCNLSYILAILMAINPWGVFLSRVPNPVSFGLAFFIFGLYFLLKCEGITNISYFFSIIILLLSLYSDKTAWIFIFCFFAVLFLLSLKSVVLVSKKKIVVTVFVLCLLCLPLFINYVWLPQFVNSLRDNNFSLFTDIGIPNGINQMRGEDIVSGYPFLGKIFYNKAFWIIKLTNNIFEHFVPRFYFSSGDQDSFHGLSNFGPLFFILIFPGVLGVISLIKKKQKLALFTVIWLFTASLPSALMSKSPNQVYFYYSIPAILIIIAYGFKQLPNKILYLIIPLLLFNMVYVYHDAINKEPLRNPQKWAVGFDQIPTINQDNYLDFDNIFITNKYYTDPIPLYLFSVKYPSYKYYQQLTQVTVAYRLWISNIGNIKAGELSGINFNASERNLFILTPQEANTILPAIDSKTGEPCYKTIRNIKDEKDNDTLLFITNNPGRCNAFSENTIKL